MIDKPKIGQPCNGCGLCCKVQVCMNGAFVLKLVNRLGDTVPGPCPALVEKQDGTFACGIILTPNKYIKSSKYPAQVLSKNFAILVGAGTGCDELGDDPEDIEIVKLDDTIEACKNDPEWRRKAEIALKVIHTR